MKKFKVSLTETLYKEFIIEAKTEEEAENTIRTLHENSEIILTGDDFTGKTDFLTEESEEEETLTEYLGYTERNYGLWDLNLKELSEEEMRKLIGDVRLELIEEDGVFRVEDLDGANLGNIEDEEFDSLEDVLKRLNSYFKN